MSAGDHVVSDPVEFGRRVRQLRRERGLKQGDLADGAVSTAYISRIESGQRRPEPRVVELLADRLGTTADYLITGIGGDETDQARLALRYAELALHSGESADARDELEKLLAGSGPALGPLRSHARLLLAQALENLGLLDDAIHELESLRSDGADGGGLGLALSLCRCYRESGDLARSIDVAERALEFAGGLGLADDDETLRLTATLAAAYFERGDTAYAAHLCRQALERAERSASPAARAATMWNSSVIASRRGQTGVALHLAERALGLLAETDDDRSLARLRLQLGILLLREQPPRLVEAREALVRARTELAEGASAVDVARCDAALALVHLHQGEIAEAERLATEVRASAAGAPLVLAQCDVVLGRASVVRGDTAQARNHYWNAVAALTGVAGDRGAAAAWFELAGLLEEAGDLDGARQAYRSAAAAAGVRAPAATPVAQTPVS
jgi:transcriptional regulator with XRE-family HTH domain/Tfp pilus assembly protein PilF